MLVSLGGNDYNHQKGHVPTNETFTTVFESFALFLASRYPTAQLVALCGMGSPLEAKLDPDDNRCKPCPHVADAVNSFKQRQPFTLREKVHYVLHGAVRWLRGDGGGGYRVQRPQGPARTSQGGSLPRPEACGHFRMVRHA